MTGFALVHWNFTMEGMKEMEARSEDREISMISSSSMVKKLDGEL